MSKADNGNNFEEIGPMVKPIEGDLEYKVSTLSTIKINLHTYKGFKPLLRELLQNSDDSLSDQDRLDKKQVHVKITFEKDRLILVNNTIFSHRDWYRISEIASFNKENDGSKTGRFGIGFTSVYQICDRLCIHSNNNSRLIDLNENLDHPKLKPIKVKYPKEKVTEFEFFWRKEKSNVSRVLGAQVFDDEKILEMIDEACREINDLIYYLKNITTITIIDHITSKKAQVISQIEITKNYQSLKGLEKETRIYNVNGKQDRRLLFHLDITSSFIAEYEESIARRKPLLLTIGLNPDEPNSGRIFCTLPTDTYSGFLFDIDSDFYPDPSRTRIHIQGPEGQYNLKIIDHIDDLLYNIIGELKNDLCVKAFYDILSEPNCNIWSNDETPLKVHSQKIHNKLMEKLRKSDVPVIAINDRWRSPSSVKLLDDYSILPFLEKAGVVIVPEEDMEYVTLFKALGIQNFQIYDMINIFKKRLNCGISLSRSIFDGDRKMLSTIYDYIETRIDSSNNNLIDLALTAPLCLTEKEELVSPANVTIYQMPQEIIPLSGPLGIEIIDPELNLEHQGLFDILGVKKYGCFELIKHLIDDGSNKFPAELSCCPAYMNDKKKLKTILRFIDPLLSQIIREHDKFERKQTAIINGNPIKINTLEHNRYSFIYSKYKEIPIILDKTGLMHKIGDRTVCIVGNSEKRQKLAKTLGIVDLDNSLRDFSSINIAIQQFKLSTIFGYVKERNDLDDETILLIYRIVNEEKGELQSNSSLKNEFMSIPIFQLSNGDTTSLHNNNNPPLLKGEYSDPLGKSDILDERLISMVKGFRDNILIDVCDIKELKFSVYVNKYYIEIFNNDTVSKEDKLTLIKELSDHFNKILESPEYAEISKTLRSSRIAYCEDGIFRTPSDSSVFIKTDNVETFLSGSYHWLDFPDIDRYKYMFGRLGVKDKVDIKDIIGHVKTLSARKVDATLIEKVKKLFIMLNDCLEDFEKEKRFQIRELREIAWLPANDDTSKLYKPDELCTQLSKDRLYARALTEHLQNIKYLDIKEGDFKKYEKNPWIKNELIEHIGLIDETRVPTEKILHNLEVASQGQKKLSRPNIIYGEFERRIKDKKFDRRSLDRLTEIKCFYDDKRNRFYARDEVFTNHGEKEKLGTEYIQFLDPIFPVKYANLLEQLKVKESPEPSTYITILKKIQDKYKNNNYFINIEQDKGIMFNCLEALNKADLNQEIIESLKRQKIIPNDQDQLISPIDAIIIDRPDLKDELPPQIRQYIITMMVGVTRLYEQLKIIRLSKILVKRRDDIVNPNAVELDIESTRIITNLREVMERIISHKSTLEDDWVRLSDDTKVYIYGDLHVQRYIVYKDQEFIIRSPDEDKKYPVYIDAGRKWIHSIYLNKPIKSDLNVQNRLSFEMCEVFHPDLGSDFAFVLRTLLSCNSINEMNRELTNARYAEIEESHARPIPDAEKLDIIGGNSEEIKEDEGFIGSAHGQESGVKFPDTADGGHDASDDLKTEDSTDDDSKMPITNQNDVHNRQRNKRNRISGRSSGTPVKYTPEPLSLDEEKEKREKIRSQLIQVADTELERKRVLRYAELDSAGKKEFAEYTRQDMETWYGGKCQICGETFEKRNRGGNYFEVIYINKTRQFGGGGYTFPGNALCLCAEHAAKMQYGEVGEFNPGNIDNGKLEIVICGRKETIKFNDEHERYIDILWDIELSPDE